MERLRKSNFETDQWGQKEKLNYNEYPEHNMVLVYTAGEEEAKRQQEESRRQIQLLIGEKLGAMMGGDAADGVKMEGALNDAEAKKKQKEKIK